MATGVIPTKEGSDCHDNAEQELNKKEHKGWNGGWGKPLPASLQKSRLITRTQILSDLFPIADCHWAVSDRRLSLHCIRSQIVIALYPIPDCHCTVSDCRLPIAGLYPIADCRWAVSDRRLSFVADCHCANRSQPLSLRTVSQVVIAPRGCHCTVSDPRLPLGCIDCR
ncbi:hypothetical protein CEXT_734191 [Caerostris extrusa]|uniref:Uncharacterized protein n=1 Tax=Caerostris extrusa TaxID=172846 RepID=A0AAV4MIP8_CAEEX|nr:hypothetical protein CEXT_734191 [Caerostris extrusa]